MKRLLFAVVIIFAGCSYAPTYQVVRDSYNTNYSTYSQTSTYTPTYPKTYPVYNTGSSKTVSYEPRRMKKARKIRPIEEGGNR